MVGCLVAAVSLIDLLQIARQDSVVGDTPHQREPLVAAAAHQMDVVLEVPQTVPLGDLVYVPGHLKGRGEKKEKGKDCKLRNRLNFLVLKK